MAPDPVDVQRHAPGKIVHRLLVAPLLQQLTQPQKEHHGACRIKFPPYHRKADGDPIQDLYPQMPLEHAADGPEQIGDRAYDGIGCPKRRWKKQGADRLKGHHAHQFFFIGAVELPDAVDTPQLVQSLVLIGEAFQGIQEHPAAALVFNDGTTGPVMDDSSLHSRKRLKPRLQQISLLQRHSGLRHLNADPAAAFVFDLKFHACLHGREGPPFGGPSQIFAYA